MVLERYLDYCDWLFSDKAFAVDADNWWGELTLHQNSLAQGFYLRIGFNERILFASRS